MTTNSFPAQGFIIHFSSHSLLIYLLWFCGFPSAVSVALIPAPRLKRLLFDKRPLVILSFSPLLLSPAQTFCGSGLPARLHRCLSSP